MIRSDSLVQLRSTNGSAWFYDHPEAPTWAALAYSPLYTVRVGYFNDWSLIWVDGSALIGDSSAIFSDVIWTGNQFVVVGSVVLTSPDGLDWTPVHTFPSDQLAKSIAFSGKLYVVVGDFGIATSPDLMNWTVRAPGVVDLVKVVWNGKRFAAVGCNGEIHTSE